MDALAGGAALHIGDVAAQRLLDVGPRLGAAAAGQDPAVHQSAERGPVAGAGQVVVDGAAPEVVVEAVSQPREEGDEFVRREEVAEHEDVGLFGRLVAVDAVALRLQDPVKPADVSVAGAVAVPVEFGEAVVALELADDTVVEGDAQGAGDLLPALEFGVRQTGALGEFATAGLGERPQQFQGAGEDPGGGDVGVGVVVEAGAAGVRVGVVVLVGAHHAEDAVPARGRVPGGGVRPEPGDLQQHLGAAGVQELGVAARLAVLPHVVRDRRSDVVLEVGVVGQPAARAGVEVQPLGLLPSVAAALPRVQRPAPAEGAGRRAGGFQAPVAVGEQGPGDLGEVQVEVRQHEQLVPEDVPAVGLAVQPARGDADVEVGGVRGEGLQDVEEVQPQDVAGFAGDLEPGPAPQLLPGGAVVVPQFREAGRRGGPFGGGA